MKRVLLLIISFIVVLSLTACADKGYEDIGNERLIEMMEDADNYQFIDVRTNDEFYNNGRINGFTNIDSVLILDDPSVLDNLDKSIPVVIMCNSGNRSVDASLVFVEEGFTTVYNLEDGIQGWDGETE